MDATNEPHPTPYKTRVDSVSGWKIISAILATALIFSGLFMWNLTSNKTLEPQQTSASIVPTKTTNTINSATQTQSPSPISGMTALTKVGLQFTTPKALDYYLPLVEAEVNQQYVSGSTYCATFTRTARKEKVPLCGDNDVMAGAISIDFNAGRETSLFDIQGYTQKNGTYVVRLFTSTFDVPEGTAREITSNFGVQMLLIKPKEVTSQEEYGIGYMWPKKGYLAAVVKTQSPTYPALVFLAKIDNGISRQTFEELLMSLRPL